MAMANPLRPLENNTFYLVNEKEFLNDYATEETRKIGNALIDSETGNVPNPKTRQILLENLDKIEGGMRDFRF